MRKKKASASRQRARLVTPSASRCAVDQWVVGLGLREVHRLHRNLRVTLYFWTGEPSAARLDEIAQTMPILEQCIDFAVLKARLARLSKFPTDKAASLLGRTVPLTDFAPEIGEVYNATDKAAKSAKANVLERAEAWLRPIADNASADGDVEAAVYFASRGEFGPEGSTDLRESWMRVLRAEVNRLDAGSRSRSVDRMRGDDELSAEAAHKLLARKFVTRFFSFRDEEADYIDAAFVRAVEWLKISGFESWVETSTEEVLAGPQGPLDPTSAYWLFFQLRSDSIALRTRGPAAQTWIWSWTQVGPEKGMPWRQFGCGPEGTFGVCYSTAAIYAFAWQRLGSLAVGADVAVRALAVVMGSQNIDGGWPLVSGDLESSLLGTCLALHALALCKPAGWEAASSRGRLWIEKAQERFGHWHLRGGQAVMLTVLALDSINLAGGGAITFTRELRKGDDMPGTAAEQEADGAAARPPNIRVLVSYAWEDEAYRELVARLAARLRSDGIDARLDRWNVDDRPLPDFMASEVRKADKVLMLCSPAYKKKVHAMQDGERATGAGLESALLTSAVFNDYTLRKKILVVVARGDAADAVPDGFAGLARDKLSLDPFDEAAYQTILRRLYGGNVQAPALGPRLAFPADELRPLRGADGMPPLAARAARVAEAHRLAERQQEFEKAEGVNATQAEFQKLPGHIEAQLREIRAHLPVEMVPSRAGAHSVRLRHTSLSFALERGPYGNVLEGWHVRVTAWRGASPYYRADLSQAPEQLGQRAFVLGLRAEGIGWNETSGDDRVYTGMELAELALGWALEFDTRSELGR